MTNSEDDRTIITRLDALHLYLALHLSAGAEDGQVKRAARCVLPGAASFNAFPFYSTALECVTHTHTHSQFVQTLTHLRKAAELLEIICLNLLLYPWRKEIRTLKKFTGQFVYYIQPVLPSQTIKSILQSIGYSHETDTEYKMSDNADPETAKIMGFELFLARLECEHLLEVTAQRSHVECLEIIRKRAAPLNPPNPSSNAKHSVNVTESETTKLEELDESQLNGDSLTSQDNKSLQSLRPSELLDVHEAQNTISEERKPPSPYLSDDRSILEMKDKYPDLAFRQKPIFKKPQRTPASPKIKDWACREPADVHFQAVSTDLSGPQSIAFHAESVAPPHRNLHIPASVAAPWPTEDKQTLVLRVESVLKPGFMQEVFSDEGLVTELTEKMGKLQTQDRDEPLKYPVEETAQCPGCQDYIAISPRELTPPPVVVKSPSQQIGCDLTGCGGCASTTPNLTQDDPTKEPPQSFYIPNCLSSCSPTPVAPTTTDLDHTCSECPGADQQLHRNPTHQPEDELDQTYVML